MDHEYALIGGINRSTVGRWLFSLASAVSALLVFLLLYLIDVAHVLGVSPNIPPSVFSLFGAAAVYTAAYFTFSNYLWKCGPLAKVLRLPDLSGIWECSAISSSYLNEEFPDGFPWNGKVEISQTWDKIFVVMTTDKSRSESVSGALISEGNGQFRLLYHYKNDPRTFEADLNAHHGFVDLIVSSDLESGNGVYFTGRGRTSFGTMRWKRKTDGPAH